LASPTALKYAIAPSCAEGSGAIAWRCAFAHDLEPKLRDQMLKCFYDYRFNAEMQKAFDGADRFVPVTFLKDWAIVRLPIVCACGHLGGGSLPLGWPQARVAPTSQSCRLLPYHAMR